MDIVSPNFQGILWLVFVLLKIVVFQQLEIDYVIGESHKELLPNSSGPAAIIRIFGVTREGILLICVFLVLSDVWVYEFWSYNP